MSINHEITDIKTSMSNENSVQCLLVSSNSSQVVKMLFFKQIQIYILVFILFGLWSTLPNSKHKLWINMCSLLSILLMCVCCSSAYYFDKILPFSSLTNTVSNFLYIFLMITHIIIIAESCRKKRFQSGLIQNLSLVDHLLKINLKRMVPYHKEKYEIFILCFVLLLIMVLVNIFLITYHRNNHFNFMYVSMLSNNVMSLRLVQIIFFIYILRNRLILINKELQSIRNPLSSFQSNHLIQRNLNTRSMRFGSTSNNSVKSRVEKLKQIYSKLHDACEQINEAFGFSLLMITIKTLMKIIANFYWGYFCMYDISDFFIYSLIPSMLFLGILSFYCSDCFQYVSLSCSLILILSSNVYICLESTC